MIMINSNKPFFMQEALDKIDEVNSNTQCKQEKRAGWMPKLFATPVTRQLCNSF